MDNVRERILAAFDDAVHAGLATDGGPPVTRLERARQRAVDDAQRPAAIVIGGGEQRATEEATGQDEYRMTVEVWGFVTAGAEESVERAINDLYARVVRAASADPALGGLADDLRLRAMQHDLVAEGGKRTADFVAEFGIEYATEDGDPFRRLGEA